MKSSRNNPITGIVNADEFFLGGKEKESYNCYSTTKNRKVKRMYAIKIEDFSAQYFQYIFINRTSPETKVTIDK